MKWPDNNSPERFESLVEAVVDALEQVYELTRRTHGDVLWRGPPLPGNLVATSLSFEKRLTKEMLDYDEQEQGRSPIEVIVGIAIQLGIEQGRRRSVKKLDTPIRLLGLCKRHLEDLSQE